MPLIASSAYLLVSHGSRDPRPQQSLDRLLNCLTAQANEPNALLAHSLFATGVLECADVPLQDRIVEVAEQAQRLGLSSLTLVPLFLLPGVHVMEDIPSQVAAARDRLAADCLASDRGSFSIAVLPHLGESEVLGQLVQSCVEGDPLRPAAQRILISHGSRRSGGNRPVEKLAQQMGAISAYWSVEPKITTVIQQVIQEFPSATSTSEPASETQHELELIPYFLFPGGITDAIATQVADCLQPFPHYTCHWHKTLDTHPHFAEAILKHIDLSLSRTNALQLTL
ncbi:MAG: sirohydrochlorin chelatase [Synechococcales bacterium]|nr:sirohydrochlorin chelatase [Synechococcales bacterium]